MCHMIWKSRKLATPGLPISLRSGSLGIGTDYYIAWFYTYTSFMLLGLKQTRNIDYQDLTYIETESISAFSSVTGEFLGLHREFYTNVG